MKRKNTDIKLGSEIDNNFRCEENNKNCEFYGWIGQDKLFINKKTNKSYFKDFKKDKTDDFLIIKNNYQDIQVREKIKNDTVLFVKYYNQWKSIILEGVDKEEVEEWLKIAQEDKNLKPTKKRKNPIYIE